MGEGLNCNFIYMYIYPRDKNELNIVGCKFLGLVDWKWGSSTSGNVVLSLFLHECTTVDESFQQIEYIRKATGEKGLIWERSHHPTALAPSPPITLFKAPGRWETGNELASNQSHASLSHTEKKCLKNFIKQFNFSVLFFDNMEIIKYFFQ